MTKISFTFNTDTIYFIIAKYYGSWQGRWLQVDLPTGRQAR